jgi:hypothetical protein
MQEAAVVARSLQPHAGSGLVAQLVMSLYVDVQFGVHGSVGNKGGNVGRSACLGRRILPEARTEGTRRSILVITKANILCELDEALDGGCGACRTTYKAVSEWG